MPDSSLRARKLADVRMHVVASPDYWEVKGRPTHPSELGNHDCLCYSNLQFPDVWRFRGPGEQAVSVQVKARMLSNSGDSMLPALRSGIGVAVLPDFIVGEDMKTGRLEEVLAHWMPPPVGLHLVMPPSRLRPARVEALVEFLARRHGC